MTITDEYFKYTTTWKEKYGEKTLVLMQLNDSMSLCIER